MQFLSPNPEQYAMNDPTDLLTADELADRLQIKPNTVRVWGRRGLIPRVQLSPKVIRYELTAVVRAIRDRQHSEGGQP